MCQRRHDEVGDAEPTRRLYWNRVVGLFLTRVGGGAHANLLLTLRYVEFTQEGEFTNKGTQPGFNDLETSYCVTQLPRQDC